MAHGQNQHNAYRVGDQETVYIVIDLKQVRIRMHLNEGYSHQTSVFDEISKH